METSPELYSKRPLLRLLETINRHGSEGISTRAVLAELPHAHHALLKRAADEGFITRERQKLKKSVGQPAIVNKITPEGARLVRDS